MIISASDLVRTPKRNQTVRTSSVHHQLVVGRDTRGIPFGFVPSLCRLYQLDEDEVPGGIPDAPLIRIEDTTLIPAIHEEFEQVASAKGIGGLLRRHTPGLALIVSQSCNLGCSYCLAKQGTFGLPVVNMKIDDVRRRLEDFFTRQPDIDFIKFFGGEPTLRMDLIRGVCDFVTRDLGRSVHFALTTNGTLDARSHLETWQRYHMSVSVSVDGPAEIHDAVRTHKDGRGSFREAIRYCDTLSRENFPFAVVGVFDERHLSAGMSYLDTIRYLNTHSSLTKVVFVEALGDATNAELCSKPEAAHRARKQVNDAVDAIMANATEHWIKPGGPEWVYDNNLFRFLSGIVAGTAVPYEHACTASNLTTLFPSGAMMSCYTLSEKPGFGLGNATTTPEQLDQAQAQLRERVTWARLGEQGTAVPWYRGVVGDICLADMMSTSRTELESSPFYHGFQESAVFRILQHLPKLAGDPVRMGRLHHAIEEHRKITGEYTQKMRRASP